MRKMVDASPSVLMFLLLAVLVSVFAVESLQLKSSGDSRFAFLLFAAAVLAFFAVILAIYSRLRLWPRSLTLAVLSVALLSFSTIYLLLAPLIPPWLLALHLLCLAVIASKAWMVRSRAG